MTTAAVLILIWRIGLVVLATAGLLLMSLDVKRRRLWSLGGAFYRQAFALLLVGVIWGVIQSMVTHGSIDPPRAAVTTVALVYFDISLLTVERALRNERRERR